ncbi:hypothetical protein GCM10027026_11680 [Myroides odoratimimus subsp. xuanwuensis]
MLLIQASDGVVGVRSMNVHTPSTDSGGFKCVKVALGNAQGQPHKETAKAAWGATFCVEAPTSISASVRALD